MKECPKDCSTIGSCPFAYTEESEYGQNSGCLPCGFEIINMRVYHGKTWACHSDSTKPCLGAINYLKENNLPYKVIDSKLLTLDDDWIVYSKKPNDVHHEV